MKKGRIKESLWIFALCAGLFTWTGAIWIHDTYGDLSFAIADRHFLRFLEGSRRSFIKEVFLPSMILFFILCLSWRKIREKMREWGHERILLLASCLMTMISFVGAAVYLDVGKYVVRQYRLHQKQWYDENRIIVHALGEIDGQTYTNSREALEKSYQNGARFLECDLSITADRQLAACHDWDFWYGWWHDAEDVSGRYVPDIDEFMATPVIGGFTALSGEELVLFMKEHADLYIITDTKDDDPDTLGDPFELLVELVEQNDCEEVLQRFIVQIYNEGMYEIVEEIYPFPNYIFTLYQTGFSGSEEEMESYARSCMAHDIDVIAMWADLYSERLMDIANRYDLQIFVHTVNDKAVIRGFLEKDVGVYTDIVEQG